MPTADIFGPALAEMQGSGAAIYGPQPFRAYLAANGLAGGSTADRISINDWNALPMTLKAENTMVLRLGSTGGGITNFALIRVADVHDFFLFDVAGEVAAKTFLSPASLRDLVGYSLLRPSETTLVNLAFASGLLPHALGLDDEAPLLAPARGVLRSTFRFSAHSSIESTLDHVNGQIEADALFVGRRDGRDLLFVIEAKQSASPLAKHKLVYPTVALAPAVPTDMPIIPVYLRAEHRPGGYRYVIAACEIPDPRESCVALNELTVAYTKVLTLPLGTGAFSAQT